MNISRLLSVSAVACIAAATTADVTGVYTTRYVDTSANLGGATFTNTVIDLYVSSDDNADTVLGVFDFSLAPDGQVYYFQSSAEYWKGGKSPISASAFDRERTPLFERN